MNFVSLWFLLNTLLISDHDNKHQPNGVNSLLGVAFGVSHSVIDSIVKTLHPTYITGFGYVRLTLFVNFVSLWFILNTLLISDRGNKHQLNGVNSLLGVAFGFSHSVIDSIVKMLHPTYITRFWIC
ncbi:MAG: hypothetical protein F6K47_13120 [Symploca sp. SIO2E6]|nr:hypothetical protein [Symploca sp. SIO2E6]